MAYFDNAATTFPKPECVYAYMDEYYRKSGGSAGRGSYSLANSTRRVIDETRRLLQELLHCPAKQVVFTPTATVALNIVIQGIIKSGAKNIFITPFEHNAVTRTLHHFEQQGIVNVFELAVSDSLEYDLDRIKYKFDSVKPDLVIMSHASNVIGLVAPVADLCALAKSYKALTLIDMAQTAGLVDLNVGLETIDFAVFAGHKTLFGPTGISGFVMNPTISLPPILFGGTGYESANQNMPESIPERYEMGTINTIGIAGLNAALKWVQNRTITCLNDEEQIKRERLISILSDYDYIKMIGYIKEREYVGIVSCLFDGISSDSAGGILQERGIAVRTGLHCAPRAHIFLGTYPAGTIRFSVNTMTTECDFNDLRNALDDLAELI